MMLYPVKHYVDWDPVAKNSNGMSLELLKKMLSIQLGISHSKFMKRFLLINKLLDEYRSDGYRVHWVYFSIPENLDIPDDSSHHPMFVRRKNDCAIAAGVTRDKLNANVYPNGVKLINKISGLKELILGGFHKDDCVRKIKDVARKQGVDARIDSDLTEDFFRIMYATCQYSLDAKLIREGFLDPVMHEDDPAEMIKLELGERLAKYYKSKIFL